MANLVNFSTYGFLDDILALNEDNWRKFFKPIIYDSVQGGLEVTTGTGMTVNVSAGECRCGSIMGISNSQVSLDVNVGDSTYNRIDSVVIQYVQGDPSTLSISILEGEPSASPVPPTLTKSYNSLWQIEIAQILVPSNVTTASQCTITDKRIIYNSLDSLIDPINEDINDINGEIQTINEDIDNINTSIDNINEDIQNINTDIDNINTNKLDNSAMASVFDETLAYAVGDVVSYQGKIYKFISSHALGAWNASEVNEITAWYEKADNGAVAPVFSELATYAVDACVMYQGKLYKFLSAHNPGPWIGGNEVVETNALAQSGGGGGTGGIGDEITFNDSNSAMIITSSNRSITSLESAVAIISSGDTHPAITSGQYVYIKLHTGVSGIVDLPEGLYIANSDISANGALTTSNVSSVSGGGLNSLKTQVDNLETQAGNLETQVDNLETQVDNLETQVDNLETQVDNLETQVDNLEVLVVDCGTISSIPTTINTGSALKVESDMVVLQSTFGTPRAATSNWTISTYDGYLIVGSGTGETIKGSTSLILYLMKSRS